MYSISTVCFVCINQALCVCLSKPTQSTFFRVLFASLLSGWATTIGKLLGPNKNNRKVSCVSIKRPPVTSLQKNGILKKYGRDVTIMTSLIQNLLKHIQHAKLEVFMTFGLGVGDIFAPPPRCKMRWSNSKIRSKSSDYCSYHSA